MAIEDAPRPRWPEIPRVDSVEQLLPKAKHLVLRRGGQFLDGLNLKPGMKVVILCDSTNDSLVREAFCQAIQGEGGKVDVIMLHGYPGMTDPVELVDSMFSRNWVPSWVWEPIREADVLMQAAHMKRAHTPNLPVSGRSGGRPLVVDMEWTADLLASDYEDFPLELRDTIDKKTWELLGEAKEISLTDLEGTDLSLSLTDEDWKRARQRAMERQGLPYMPGHLMVPLPHKTLQGVFATSSLTFGGPVPRTRMRVEGGQVVRVEGSGKLADTLAESFEKHKGAQFPKYPGLGANWVSTMGICTHPQARRSPRFDEMTGSGRVHAWAFGHRRSGVIHMSIGEAMVSQDYKIIRHFDLYFPTLIADGRKVIEKGHLMALDDPEVRQAAAKYGSPEELLREGWIPEVPGVNIP
jgi:hypothetical protein